MFVHITYIYSLRIEFIRINCRPNQMHWNSILLPFVVCFVYVSIVHRPLVLRINDTNRTEYVAEFCVCMRFASTETFTGELLTKRKIIGKMLSEAAPVLVVSVNIISLLQFSNFFVLCHREELILNDRVQEVREHFVVASRCTINTLLMYDVHRSPSMTCSRVVFVCLAFPHCKFYGNA